MRIFSAFLIKPSGADVQLGDTTLTSTGIYVYANLKFISGHIQELYTGISSGTIYGIDLAENTMSTSDLLGDLVFVADQANGVFNLSKSSHQVLWNMQLAHQVVAFVRGQMLDISMSQLGISPTDMLQKLSSVISAVNVGMYKEAALMLQYQTTRDAFLTEERVSKYINVLTAADAIDYTIT